MLAPNTLLQNRYLVIRHLSRGGMGAVYLVKHQRLGKTFALKETFFSDDGQLRKAFEREAQLLANLDHPVLPKVTDHFTEGDSQYLVMEYIPGEDLGAQLLASGKPFPTEQVLEWADQLLDALDYLHSNDPPIIHRDIKPPNLKLTLRGHIILLDFGLAKGETMEMSRMSRSVFGYTPNYAPLEQIMSEGTDARSDLYSLAATLYHLITGEIPPRVTERIAVVADGQPDPLRLANEMNPEVPAAAAAVLQQAMARNRNQRLASAAAMREALHIARQATLIKTTPSPLTIVSEDKIDKASLSNVLTEQDSSKKLKQIIYLVFVVVGVLLLNKLFIDKDDRGGQKIDQTALNSKIQNGELIQAIFKPQEVAVIDKSGQEFRVPLANEFRRAELMKVTTEKDANGKPKVDKVEEEKAANSVPSSMIGIAAFVLVVLICSWWWLYGRNLRVKIILLMLIAIGVLLLYKVFANPQSKVGQNLDQTAFEEKIQSGELKQTLFMPQDVVAMDRSGNEFVVSLSNEFRRAELMKLAATKDEATGKAKVDRVEEVIADNSAWLWALLSVSAVFLIISVYGWRWLGKRR